jgi:CHAT domain-containing protein
MECSRYYLACLFVGALASAAHGPPQAAKPPAAAADCAPLAGEAAPVEPESPALTKRLIDCGYELNAKSEFPRAQAVFERATQMATRLSDRKGLAGAIAGSGMILRALGQADRAEPLLRQSLAISEEIGDRDGMAFAFSQLGRVRNMQARYDEARDFHTRSFELWNDLGDRQGVAVALNNVGAMYRAVGDYMTALDYYERSLDALEQLGDRRGSSTVLDNMGSVARALGDHAKARTLALRALEIREALNDRLGISHSMNALAVLHQAEGNYAAALVAQHKSLAIRQSLGAAHGTAEALNNVAQVYQAQGDYAQAVSYLTRALAVNEQVGSKSLLAEIQTHLGELFSLQGRDAEALKSLKRSLTISQAAGYKSQAAEGLYTLGRLYLKQGRTASAAEALQQSLELHQSPGALRGRADALIELGEVELRRGHHERGLARASEGEQLARTMELPDVRWRALTTVGRIAVAMRRPGDARRAFDEAIAVVEDLRVNVAGGDETRSRFFADRQAPYREQIALALAESRTADAFSFAERSKARALLDVLRGDRLPIAGAMTEQERKKELAFRTALSSVNSQVVMAAQAAPRDEARVTALRRRRDAKRLEYEDFQSALYASHPELRIQRGAIPIAQAHEAGALLSSPSAAIVEFVIGQLRVWAFTIDASGTKVFELPLSGAELARQVERFRGQLAARDLRAPETARQLYDRVLGPLRTVLRGKKDVTVVPDGVLWNLPFQALQSSTGRYLIEDVAISYAPSVTALRETMRLRRRTAGPSLLAFGNPALPTGAEPLPDAEVQVRQLGKWYGASSRVYVGADASEARWKAEAPRHDILHLASHGVVDNRSPLYSYVALARSGGDSADDGLVEAWEIMNLPLKARLVVLSACETARGQLSAGEGVIGLMWAVFVAGSPATLVSQWKADSSSSTRLMVAFHKAWNGGRSGVSKARALQLASLELLRARDSAHPFHWAGYILVGDAR